MPDPSPAPQPMPPTKPNAEILFPDELPKTESKASPPKPTASAVGLPEFVNVLGAKSDTVSVSRKPRLDGFEWLKVNGYRTVVYLHGADSELNAMRTIVERNGLAFVPILVTPESLKTAFETFRKLLADKTGRPVHISDDDSARTGSLLYLYFRIAEVLADDQARVRSGPAGLKEVSSSELQKSFWLAIQEFLSNR